MRKRNAIASITSPSTGGFYGKRKAKTRRTDVFQLATCIGPLSRASIAFSFLFRVHTHHRRRRRLVLVVFVEIVVKTADIRPSAQKPILAFFDCEEIGNEKREGGHRANQLPRFLRRLILPFNTNARLLDKSVL